MITLKDEAGLKSELKFNIIASKSFGGVVVKSATSNTNVVKRELLARVFSVSANGLVKVLFTESIISKETKDLLIIDQALSVIVMKFDEEKGKYSIPVGIKWTCA